MEYTVKALADLAGVTPRTLRWYDRIGLLKPLRTPGAGYRLYGPKQLDRLQDILFYRELGLDLASIRAILDDPAFDRQAALQSHDCEELVQLIKTVYAKSRRHGRRVSQVDQRYRKRAEELLNSELSVARGIPLKEVPAYINQRIGKLAVCRQGAM